MSNTVREKLEVYFASLNSTSSRMMADIISSREEFSDRWENMPPDEQSEILWRSIVKPEAITKYQSLPAKSLDVEYFPVLRTRPGEKIIVDEDSASAKSFVSGSTWQDEHSAPFRWETQSQLELRIHDDDDDEEEEDDAEKEKVKTLQREEKEKVKTLQREEKEKVKTLQREEKEKVKTLQREEKEKVKTLQREEKERVKTLQREEKEKVKTLQRDTPKLTESEKQDVKKEEEVKRPTVKRPEVPPPPVPPHATPPPTRHAERPPVPPHTEKSEKGEIPIYAKVVKRKNQTKTLVISEMKAHRKAREEMKPAVPPRMSLELRGDMDLSKFRVQDIDIDGIPKTGFDFLDNW